MAISPYQGRSVEAWSHADLLRTVSVMLSIAGCCLALVWFVYCLRFGPLYGWLFGAELADSRAAAQAAWGQLGDFVGGTLNPLLSGLTLVGLVFTLLFQHQQLADVKSAAAKQHGYALDSARLQALAAALGVISEMHAQALLAQDMSAIDLGKRKQSLADEILLITERLRQER